MDPLFIGLSMLHHRHRSVTIIPPSTPLAEFFSSISEDSNCRGSQQSHHSQNLDGYHSPESIIKGREFEEKHFLPSDFSVSSIREAFNSILTLTDSNEYRHNLLNPLCSPPLHGLANLPHNPSLFKKHLKPQGPPSPQIEKENNGLMERLVPKSSGRDNERRKKGHQPSSSIIMMGENQWFGLKTSRVLSPQLIRARQVHFM